MGVVALPGRGGTLEELWQANTLKRLGLHTEPIVILNTGDDYGPMKEILTRCVVENFMDERHLDTWVFVDDPKMRSMPLKVHQSGARRPSSFLRTHEAERNSECFA
jgi:predicted Rossmann-fold nucleotide-binding protein